MAALAEAAKAESRQEIPVGCVIVRDEKIIACAHNSTQSDGNATAHAEMKAINEACRLLGTGRLNGCELYVTLEPCPMCAWAIICAGVTTVVFGAADTAYGAFGGRYNLAADPKAAGLTVYGGIMEKECGEILKAFFAGLRGGTPETTV